MLLDTTNWSGEGEFTETLIEVLKKVPHVAFLRVENAPATRSEADYNFISNELYVVFEVRYRTERVRRFGFLPAMRSVPEKMMTLGDLEATLTKEVGPPDYGDESMLQYLRSERIIPPYQTKGYKLVELVRIYEAGTEGRR